MTRPKILYVVPRLGDGGTEQHLLRLLSRLPTNTLDYSFACLRRQGPLVSDFEKLSVPITEFSTPHNAFGRIRRVVSLAQFMRREHVTIVETMMGMTSFYGALAACLARVPVIICNQREMGYNIDTRTRRLLLKLQMRYLSTHVIANAWAIKESLVRGGFCPGWKIAVVYSGIPMDMTATPQSIDAERRRLGLSASDIVIGCVARLVTVKGLDNLVRTIPLILGRCPRVRIVIVGEGPERRKLERMRQELGIEHALVLAGYSSDPSEIIACSDICVQPSLSEGLPTAVLEYMRAAKPVVATTVGGIPEAVTDQETGFLVEPGNLDALSDRIIRLASDPSLRKRMGEKGREIVHRRFDIGRVIRDYELLYHELVRGTGSDFSAWASERFGG